MTSLGIFRKYSMKKFSSILLEGVSVVLGEEEPFDEIDSSDDIHFPEGSFLIPIILNGVEYGTNEINFTVVPITKMDHGVEKTLYRPDIKIAKELRHQGIGYKIYKEFINKYGNLISINQYRQNDVEIPRIYDKLSREENINVLKDDNCIFACTDEWIDEYGDELELDLFSQV